MIAPRPWMRTDTDIQRATGSTCTAVDADEGKRLKARVSFAADGVDGPAGRLQASAAAVTRVRTGLEVSRAYTLAGRLSLTPSVEVGLRHDGGTPRPAAAWTSAAA